MVDIDPKEFESLNSDQKCSFFISLLEYGSLCFAMGSGANLLSNITSSSSGFRFLGIILIFIGVVLLVLLCVTCTSCASETTLHYLKAASCTIPLLVVMTALGIFALVVSTKGGGKSIPGRAYEEYEVESYSKWMRNKVNDTHNWETYYKKAVVKGHVCNGFFDIYELDTLDEFYERSLDPLESGCCKPPEECNFDYTSPAIWIKPSTKIANYSNDDCNRWNNDPNMLCFNCQSCKAAFLQDLKSHWFDMGLDLVVWCGFRLLLVAIWVIYRMYHEENHSNTHVLLV